MISHDVTEDEGRSEVIVVVFKRLLCGFADCFVARKVNDCVDFLCVEEGVHAIAVAYIHFVEFRACAADCFDAVYDHSLGVVKIVGDDNVIACVYELYACMASDKAGSACHKNCHDAFLLLF